MPVEIRKRDMKLSDHNISRDKYNELKYFCLQYWQKKQEIDRNYGIDGFSQDGMPRGTSSSNPTEKKALRIAQLKRDTDLIEQTAMEADTEIYPWILKNVTSGVPYDTWMCLWGERNFMRQEGTFFSFWHKKDKNF